MTSYHLCLQKRIKDEIQGKYISVRFDGTVGEVLAIIVRFVDNWKIEQRLIRLQLLVKTMTGEEIARELVVAIHTQIDNVGEHFKTPTHEEFIRLWISFFVHSLCT